MSCQIRQIIPSLKNISIPYAGCMDNEFVTKDPPAKLSRKAIEEFKQIYREECGDTISDAEALEMGLRVLRLFQVIYRPIPLDHHNDKDCDY